MSESTEFIDLHPYGPAVQLSAQVGFEPAATSIGYDGEVVRLWVSPESLHSVFGRIIDSGGASFPKTQTQNTYAARVTVTSSFSEQCYELDGVTATFPLVQMLPGRRIIVVGSRCTRFLDGTAELNARIFRQDGTVESEFCLGDGIEHLQTDREGRLWVGYFDEGVFGNNGWLFGDDKAGPIGSPGLVRFGDTGQKQWEFKSPEGFGSISDCYALNVSAEGTWLCYYTDFPIAHVDRNDRESAWKSNLYGPRQIAVSGNLALAFGGYEGHRTDCSLVEFEQGTAPVKARVKLFLPEDVDLGKCAVLGRGPLLHVLSKEVWYSFSVPN